MKSKVGELQDEVREVFTRRLRKNLTRVVQGVSGKSRLLVRFKDGYEKDMTSNQISVMTEEKIPMTKEADITMISVVPYDIIYLEKGYYNSRYVMIHLKREGGVDVN